MTTYYVDQSRPDDSGDGLSEGTAWKTLSQVAATAFSAGDSILLKRGGAWGETLVWPSSGSDGSPITLDAYGVGADPIIDGSAELAGWAQESIGTNLLTYPNDFTNWTLSAASLSGAVENSDGDEIALGIIPDGSTADHGVYTGTGAIPTTAFTFLVDVAAAQFDTPWIFIMLAFYSSGSPVNVGYAWFNLDACTAGVASADATYAVPLKNNFKRVGITVTSGAGVDAVIPWIIAADANGTKTFSGDGTSVHSYISRAKLEVGSAPTSFLAAYYTTPAVEPKCLTADDENLKLVENKQSLNAGTFFYESPYVYTILSDKSSPASAAMRAGVRDYCIVGVDKSYVTINNIELRRSNSYPLYWLTSGANINGLVSAGISLYQTAEGILVYGCDALAFNYLDVDGCSGVTMAMGGIVLQNCSGALNYCEVHDGCSNGFMVIGTSVIAGNYCRAERNRGGDYIGRAGFGSLNTAVFTMLECVADENSEDGFSAGGDSTMNCNVCESYRHGNYRINNANYSGDGYTAHLTATLNLNGCVGKENHKSGVAVTDQTGGQIINCRFEDNVDTAMDRGSTAWLKQGGIMIDSVSPGAWTIEGNFLRRNQTEIAITAQAISGGVSVDSDRNVFDPSDGANPFEYNDVAYATLAEWRAASGEGTNSRMATTGGRTIRSMR